MVFTREPKISVIVVTASRALNRNVRKWCLTKCLASMHREPGYPFELILVSNASHGDHLSTCRSLTNRYWTITHYVENRLNEYYGGGARIGAELADGDILVFAADDIFVSPNWLKLLAKPLVAWDTECVSCLQPGPNVRSKLTGTLRLDGARYQRRTRAGAYLWGMNRGTYEKVGPWPRKHFADTEMANRIRRQRIPFICPVDHGYVSHLNLNFLRPWDYSKEKGRRADMDKWEELDTKWNEPPFVHERELSLDGAPPLRNPEGEGPGCYSKEYLARHQEWIALE